MSSCNTSLPPIDAGSRELRLLAKWAYNNWGYDVMSDVIAARSGLTWGDFMETRILKPLGLGETTTRLCPPEENWAQGYMPGPDSELTLVGRPVIAAGTVQQGANGIKSTASDLLKYYKAVWDAWRQETGAGDTGDAPSSPSTPDSSLPKDSGGNPNSASTLRPLRNIKMLLSPHIPIEPDSGDAVGRQLYGAGWAIVELPAPLGSIGTNGMFVPKMPLVGRPSGGQKKPTTVWYHNGSLVGFFSSVHVLPEDGTIIIVLVNSIPKNDCADWIGQLLVQEFLENTEKNDYVALAQQSASAYDDMWRELPDEFKKLKTQPEEITRPITEYAGRYFNKLGNWFIKVSRHQDGLLDLCSKATSSVRIT